ncbi:MAG: CPBP family intramembrane glutamic endopeptidase [Pyrinomonadaceae bacterium]
MQTTAAIGNKEFLQRTKQRTTLLLWLEWTGFFILLPFVLRIWWHPQIVFATLFFATIGVAIWLLRNRNFNRKLLWLGRHVRGEWNQLKRILLRFIICGALIAALVLFVFPGNFLDMPRENPVVWAIVMIFYPLLSVYPQELIYRTFFFERYRSLFRSKIATVFASAIGFGLIHIIFQNPLAVILTLIGGVFFAETYARTRSLRLVWFEHALYGCLIFTIGLGEFFYHARVPIQ